MDKFNFKQKYSYLLFLCHESFEKGQITLKEKMMIKSK